MDDTTSIVKRLSKYRSSLLTLQAQGAVKVFSEGLAKVTGVAAPVIRRDFSIFSIRGKRKGGYELAHVLEGIDQVLGKRALSRVILAGAGNLGSSLIRHKGFQTQGLSIVAAFDADPAKHTRRGPTPVFPVEDLASFAAKSAIKIGILCVPEIAAQSVLDQMVIGGIRGVLNFAPAALKAPGFCVLRSLDFDAELESVLSAVREHGTLQSEATNKP